MLLFACFRLKQVQLLTYVDNFIITIKNMEYRVYQYRIIIAIIYTFDMMISSIIFPAFNPIGN